MQLGQEVLSLQKFLRNKKPNIFAKFSNLILFFILFSLISCATQKKGHVYIDYNDNSTILYQIKQADKLLDEGDTVNAVLRAKLLSLNTKKLPEVKKLNERAIKQAKEDFNKSLKDEKWNKALSYFRTLTTLGEQPDRWTEERILNRQKTFWKKHGNSTLLNLNNANYKNKKYPKNFKEMIKGTVTVWVDRGTKIERGVGYSDIVIGSGFFIDKDGYFITNYHVIQSEVDPKYNGYSKLYIKSPENPSIKVPAKVVGWDPLFDLALVKTEISPEFIFPLGSSKNLEIGSKIYAIGSPAGLEKTLTSGIVSTKYRRLYSLVDVMQIDAPINHGNSGGPIVNEKGFVQAVVFAGLEQNEGLNFAIPIEHLKRVLAQFYAGGKVDHAWLGAYGNKKELENNKAGIEASYILPGSALDISGVKEGTIITEFNGVNVTSPEEIQAEILTIAENTIVKMKGYEKLKNNQMQKKEWFVLCTKRPAFPGAEVLKHDSLFRAMRPLFGIELAPSGKRKKYRVESVEAGSVGDELGFTKNDYIEINGKDRYGEQEEVLQVHIYAKKVKAGYVDSFMIISSYLDNANFF